MSCCFFALLEGFWLFACIFSCSDFAFFAGMISKICIQHTSSHPGTARFFGEKKESKKGQILTIWVQHEAQQTLSRSMSFLRASLTGGVHFIRDIACADHSAGSSSPAGEPVASGGVEWPEVALFVGTEAIKFFVSKKNCCDRVHFIQDPETEGFLGEEVKL